MSSCVRPKLSQQISNPGLRDTIPPAAYLIGKYAQEPISHLDLLQILDMRSADREKITVTIS
jgi:hypothetical protein